MVRALFGASILAGVLTMGVALAEDHLRPEESSFPTYQASETSVFKAAFGSDVRARAIIEPAFFLEFAVGVKETDGRYSVFMLKPSTQIWAAELSKDKQTDPKSITATACEIPIRQTVGTRIVAVWKAILSRVKPRPAELGLDGEFDHYSMTVDSQVLAGQARSPREDSEAGMMEGIVYAIHEACEKNDKSRLAKIEPLLDRLEKLKPD